MSFERVEAPAREFYIDPAQPVSKLVLPHEELFIDELQYWQRIGKDGEAPKIAGHIMEDLITLESLRIGLHVTVPRGDFDRAKAGECYRLGATVLGMAHLWRELGALPAEHSTGFLWDHWPSEYERSSIHGPLDTIKALGFEVPPRGTLWYESSDFYTRVINPARPTTEMRRTLSRRPDRGPLVSLAPRFKSRAWVGKA